MWKTLSRYTGVITIAIYLISIFGSGLLSEHVGQKDIIQFGTAIFVIIYLPLFFIHQYKKDTFPPSITSFVMSVLLGTGLSILSVLYATEKVFGGPGFWIAAGFFVAAVVFLGSLKPGKRDSLVLALISIFYLVSIFVVN